MSAERLPFELVDEREPERPRPRRRVFASGRLRPPGAERLERAARVGARIGHVLAWAGFLCGIWAAVHRERRPR